MEYEELTYFRHFWEHILMKQMLEIEKRYFNRIPLATDLYEELLEKFGDKIVIPFADFSVATKCTLNCKLCSQWIPYLKSRKVFSADEIKGWFDEIFKYVDYIHIISPLGGEAFLNTEYGDILEYMLWLQEMGKIGFIRIVTNGTIYPNEKLQKILCNPNILILVSDYGDVLNETQQDNFTRFIHFLEVNQCKYFSVKMDWIDIGVPGTREELTAEDKRNYFESCFARDCAGIYEGNLYHCPRIYALENMGELTRYGGGVIRFDEISSKEEMRERLKRFYMIDKLDACAWCKRPELRCSVPAAEQL